MQKAVRSVYWEAATTAQAQIARLVKLRARGFAATQNKATPQTGPQDGKAEGAVDPSRRSSVVETERLTPDEFIQFASLLNSFNVSCNVFYIPFHRLSPVEEVL